MNKAEAIAEAKRLVGAPLAGQATTEDWDAAANRSHTLDTARRHPDHPDWVETVDPHWTAAEAVTVLAIRATGTGGDLEGFTSEGSTFRFSRADLWGMAKYLRSQSAIAKLTRNGGFGMLEVDGTLSGFVPTSGTGRTPTALSGGQVVPSGLDWT